MRGAARGQVLLHGLKKQTRCSNPWGASQEAVLLYGLCLSFCHQVLVLFLLKLPLMIECNL